MNKSEKNDFPLYVRATDNSPIHRLAPKMSRNSLCPLENKKFKHCCGKNGRNFCQKLLNDFFDKQKE